MKKIMEWFGGSVVKDLLGGLDNLFTSKEEKIKAQNVIKQILIQKELELQKMQTEIIVTEAKGNWLQRSWRPILMLAFGFIVIYVKFLAPLFDLRIPELENEFWNLLQLGIGGYVIGRTGEKMMNSYSDSKK
jgi:Holin of 3TMs, for gene-transfer release